MKTIINETKQRGLLIEYDAGYVSPKDNSKFINEVKESIKTKSFNFNTPVLYAVLQKYGVKNKNGRIYPKEILEREALNYMKLIEMGASAGETDHAQDAVISIKNVSMRVTRIWWEGITLIGEIYLPISRAYIESGILSHPADKIAHDIIHGFQYGVSSRGVGSLDEKSGENIVQDDFELICWDFVTAPSTHGSWVYANQSETVPHIEKELPRESINNPKKNISNDKNSFNGMGNFKREREDSLNSKLDSFMRNFK